MRTTREKVCAELTSTTKASWATIASAAREKLLECHLPNKMYNVDLRALDSTNPRRGLDRNGVHFVKASAFSKSLCMWKRTKIHAFCCAHAMYMHA